MQQVNFKSDELLNAEFLENRNSYIPAPQQVAVSDVKVSRPDSEVKTISPAVKPMIRIFGVITLLVGLLIGAIYLGRQIR